MANRTEDLDGVELAALTSFGRAQGPVLAVLGLIAGACVFGAIALLAPSTVEVVRLVPETQTVEVVHADAPSPGLELLREVSKSRFQRCRVAQLLDDVGARQPPSILGSGSRAQEQLVRSISFEGLTCRPASWLGPGSQLDTLPEAVDPEAPVLNPLWESGLDHATPEALAEAELRLYHRLESEYALIHARPEPPTNLSFPVPRPTLERIRAEAPLGLVLGLVGAALATLLALFALALVPDRQRVRFDLRGIAIGPLFVPAGEVAGAWMEDGRLVVERKDGRRHRSARLQHPAAVEPLIAQYQRLSTVQNAQMPAEMRRMMGHARKE
ncbi:MAG: hypothetical protein R3F61_33490 [Myxococcota bacterium]